jgi:hypothetical protein
MYKLLALGLLAVPSFAFAAAASGNAPAATADKGSKMICREMDETGSRLGGHRVCMTREQWEEQKRTARSAVEHAQSQQVNPCGPSGKC